MRARQTINVPDGGDIQAAILTMKPGDTLSLATGGSYTFGGAVNGFANLPSGHPKAPTIVLGNGATITGGNTSLRLTAKRFINIENLNLIDASNRCVLVTGGRYINMTNIYADSNVGIALFDVFRFDQGCRNFVVRDCGAGPTTGWGEHDGFECTNQCGDFEFINCHAEGVIHGFETWSDGGALTWSNYRISIRDCSAANCEVGYSAEGGPAGLSQIEMTVTNSTSTGMSEFDFQGIDGSTLMVDQFGGTWNGSVNNFNSTHSIVYQAYINKLFTDSIQLPATAQQTKQNAFFASILTAIGDWNRIKAFMLYAVNNEFASLIDAKRLFQMTAHNSPTYDPADGWTGNGVNAYIETGFAMNVYSTNSVGVIVARKSAHNNYFMGTGGLVLNEIASGARLISYIGAVSGAIYVSPANTDPRVWGTKRNNATHVQSIANNSPTFTVLSRAGGTPFSATTIRHLGSTGTFTGYTTGDISVVIHLDDFSEAEFVAISNAIQTYLAP